MHDQHRERASCVDRLQLRVVPDKEYLGAASIANRADAIERQRAGEGCLVDDDELSGANDACPWRFCHHFAVFSVAIPRSSASSRAAAAEGASPTTEPAPCSCSHANRSACIAVVLPAPAGPIRTSS